MEGETLTDDDVAILRPGANPRGIEPFRLNDAIGHRVLHDIPKGSSISYDDLAG
jgi:sialic acid synthase SpsE